MIRRVHHTSFTVSNMDRSLAFYRDLLQMRVIAEQGGKGGYLATVTGFADVDMRVVFLRPAEDSDHLGTPADVRTCNPGSGHMCFVVDDISPVYERLRAAGVRFRSEPVPIVAGRHKGGYAVYFLDPDGITLELLQPPPGV